ncbi:MAG TPA: hypothetical protein QF564_26600 [Pirellulaceae bacterium]|nr:hypothetical protein [Pirellulaceae bacterium]
MRPLLEKLEERLLLASDFAITDIVPVGGAGTPFDLLEIQFSRPVRDGTFTLDDVQFTNGGPLAALGLNKLTDDRYQLDATGLTGIDTYILSLGPDILDGDGDALNQDGDATGGETPDDQFTITLVSEPLLIAADDQSMDGNNLLLFGHQATIDGQHQFANVSILGGAAVTHSATTATDAFEIAWDISGRLLVDGTSSIDVTGRGVQGGGALGAGGSHAGLGGGVTIDDSHGDLSDPRDAGSGGAGSGGGSGGGVVRITTSSAQIDGTIRADGADGIDFGLAQVGGGGSGGSVLLDVSSLSGGGAISADGGDGSFRAGTGGGGGGRVAVEYGTSTFDVDDITAHAGGDSGADPAGGVGTVFLKAAGTAGTLRLVTHGTPTGHPWAKQVTRNWLWESC